MKGIFCGKEKSPLMSLKYLHRKGGGRRMWRSLVTMATGRAASWAFDPQSSAQMGLSGMGWWFQVCRERLALLPAHKPNICSDQALEVPCPQICPHRGWSWAELPAAVSFHLRGRLTGGRGPGLRSLLCAFLWGNGRGRSTLIWDLRNTSLRLPEMSSLLSVCSPFNLLWGHGLACEAGAGGLLARMKNTEGRR